MVADFTVFTEPLGINVSKVGIDHWHFAHVDMAKQMPIRFVKAGAIEDFASDTD